MSDVDLQLLGVLGNLGAIPLQLNLQLLQLPVQLPGNQGKVIKMVRIVLATKIGHVDLFPTKRDDPGGIDDYIYLPSQHNA